MLNELDATANTEQALRVLSTNGFFPIFDSGVERLLKVYKGSNDSAQKLWETSSPKYAKSYYSDNAGISELLRYAAISQTTEPLEC